jgi:hypothetical protein
MVSIARGSAGYRGGASSPVHFLHAPEAEVSNLSEVNRKAAVLDRMVTLFIAESMAEAKNKPELAEKTRKAREELLTKEAQQ